MNISVWQFFIYLAAWNFISCVGWGEARTPAYQAPIGIIAFKAMHVKQFAHMSLPSWQPTADNSIMKIGRVIHVLRKERGLTLEKVALEAETDTGNLSRIEKGTRQPSIGLLERIAAALGTKVSAIYFSAEMGRLPDQSSELQEANEVDFSDEAVQLRSAFRALSQENRRLAVDFVKLLIRNQRNESV